MYLPEKKKIRGMRRRQRQINDWKEHWCAYAHDIYNGNELYAKLVFDPFYRLIQMDPPKKLFKSMVQALTEIHDAWEEYFEKEKLDAYLKIWVFENPLIDSKVVAGIGERKEWYKHTFAPAPGVTRKPPVPLSDQFDWELKIREFPMRKTEFEEMEESEKTYWSGQILEEVTSVCMGVEINYYILNNGYVWVGTKK